MSDGSEQDAGELPQATIDMAAIEQRLAAIDQRLDASGILVERYTREGKPLPEEWIHIGTREQAEAARAGNGKYNNLILRPKL